MAYGNSRVEALKRLVEGENEKNNLRKELSKEQRNFLQKTLLPFLYKYDSDDTITFPKSDIKKIGRIRETIEDILDKGEYNGDEQYILKGMRVFYINFKDRV